MNIAIVKSLESQFELLESELSKCKKTDASQKTQIKKLTKDNDKLRRELSKFNGMRKFTVTEAGTTTSTVTSVPVQPSLADTDSELKVCKDRIRVLETYIRDTANALLDKVNISTDYVAQDDREFELVTRNKHRSRATQTETVVSPAPQGSQVSVATAPTTSVPSSVPLSSRVPGASSSSHSQHSATRGTQSAHRPTRQSTNGPGPANPAGSQASRNSNTHYRDSLLNTNVRQLPDTVIIGTSLVRGVSSNLHKRNIDNVSYCYPGAEIPIIRSRINSVLPRNGRPRQVFLQAGGNDLESHPADQVIKQFDKLIHQVKSRCSNATTILLGRIPPRRHPALTDKIKKVNTYLNNRGMRGDNVKFVDCCPSFPSQFSRDRVHFNSEGAKVYADKLACHVINFQLPGINVRC